MNKLKKFGVLLFKYLILFLILYFLIINNMEYFSKIKDYDILSINWLLIFLAVILQSFAFCFYGFLWYNLMSLFKMKLNLNESVYIWTKSQFAKYIPGMIWIAVGRVAMVNKYNFNKKMVSLTILLELILIGASMLVLGSLIWLFYSNLLYFILAFVFVLSMIILTVVFIPKLVKFIKPSDILKILILYFLNALIVGISFLMVFLAVNKLNLSSYFYVLSAFLISWVVGFVFIIAPNGIGIREASLVYLLKDTLAIPILIIIVFYSRLVWTLSEVVSFIFSKFFKMRYTRK